MGNHGTELPHLTWSAVCARRLARHHLIDAAPVDQIDAVVGVMCGAHAQVMSAAELSVGLRLSGATRAAVRGALWTEHSLIKTYGPRGTVHLLPERDLATWTGALSALPLDSKGHAPTVRLTPAQTDEIIAAISEALLDVELTIDELDEEVVKLAGPWAGERVMPAFQDLWPRWRQAMHTAAHRGVLCFGPNRGRKVTYTNPSSRLPGFAPADGQESLARLVRSYLYGYGPATPHQFARWLSAPVRWATSLFSSLGDDLEAVELGGTQAWVVAGDTAAPDTPPTGVRLLPYFDAYAVGSYPRELLFPGRAFERALAGGQAGNFPVLLIDGVVAGVWHQRRSGKRIAITVEPLDVLNADQLRALDAQAVRVGEILEGDPALTIGKVTVGPHA